MNNNLSELIKVLPPETEYVPGYMKEGKIFPKIKWMREPDTRIVGTRIKNQQYAGVIASSANIMVIDFDNHSGDGETQRLIKKHVQWLYAQQPTYVCKTKSGGFHMYYKEPKWAIDKKQSLYSGDTFIGDLQIGNNLIWAGEGYKGICPQTDLKPIPMANNKVIQWVFKHINGTPRSLDDKTDELPKYTRNRTFNPEEGWKLICMLDSNLRANVFKSLLTPGRRNNMMTGFTYWCHHNGNFPHLHEILQQFKNCFIASYDNDIEAHKVWERRQDDIIREVL